MNPDTGKFEPVYPATNADIAERLNKLLRADGTPVPDHWSVFRVGERYVIEGATFECKYIGEKCILFEPAAMVIVEEQG